MVKKQEKVGLVVSGRCLRTNSAPQTVRVRHLWAEGRGTPRLSRCRQEPHLTPWAASLLHVD
jgi:hypothetical protein